MHAAVQFHINIAPQERARRFLGDAYDYYIHLAALIEIDRMRVRVGEGIHRIESTMSGSVSALNTLQC